MGVLGGQDSGLEILLGEGGDVELGARTSKHIFVFVFDPLPLNPLSLLFVQSIILHSYHICLYFPCIDSYSLFNMLGLFVCASLVHNHKSFI